MFKKDLISRRFPITTKKKGTINSANGLVLSCSSNRSAVSAKTIPAKNDPIIAAKPIKPAKADKPRHIVKATTNGA